jgi:BlaI family penicillinase repressor
MTTPPQPTRSELELLRILWALGPSTVREVHGALPPGRRAGYTTVLKLLQIMTEKGLVTRDESRRSHVYRAQESEEATQEQLVGDLVERAFGGSSTDLVMRALSARHATPAELDEVRRLLDDIEDRQGEEAGR